MTDYFSNQSCEWIFQQMLKWGLALNILKRNYFISHAFVLFCRFYALTLLEILQ